MKILFILLTVNWFVFSLQANDGNKVQEDRNIVFSLKKLEDIGSQMPSACLVNRDTVMPCPEICKNKSIIIRYNTNHQVSHLGVSMFSAEMKDIINKPVCDFVERLLLELILMDTNQEVLNFLNHNNINILKNGVKYGSNHSIRTILSEIQESVRFTLTHDAKSYIVTWEYDPQNMFVIQFPINRELISGANKIESDNLLLGQLKDSNCNAATVPKTFLSDDSKLTSTDGTIYICKGDTFILGSINENRYYKKITGGYDLIYDEKFPKETLSNLFFGNFEQKKLKLHITHSMYGNFNPEYDLNLRDFVCYFIEDYNVYTASYQNDPNIIKATVIFQNKQYNYIHLLMISTSKENLFKDNGVINASFRSNIPQHNIKSLIGEFNK